MRLRLLGSVRVIAKPLRREHVEHRHQKNAGAAGGVEHTPIGGFRVTVFDRDVQGCFGEVARRVKSPFVVFPLQVRVLHELLVDRADGFHGDDAKVVIGENRMLAGRHFRTAKKIGENIQVRLANVARLGLECGVKHGAIEFPLQRLKKSPLAIKQAFDFLEGATFDDVEEGMGLRRKVLRLDEPALVEKGNKQRAPE